MSDWTREGAGRVCAVLFGEEVGAAAPAVVAALEEAIATLQPNEQAVLRARFSGATRVSYQTAALVLGPSVRMEGDISRQPVTRERIRMIEAKALRKLRHPSRSDAIRRAALAMP